MSKIDELNEYLKSKGVVSFHVDVVDGADPEKVAEEVLRTLKHRDSIPLLNIPQDQLEDLYERFCRLLDLCRYSIDEWIAMPPAERDMRRAIFEQADFGAVIAGQYLPSSARRKVFEQIRAPHTEGEGR